MRIGKIERSHGFTLLAVLAACVLLALATQGVMFVLSQQAQRERETQLLRIGNEFVSAIGTYYESSPGSAKRFPVTLEELVEDHRFVGIKRHLRRIYTDPVTGSTNWGLVTNAEGGIEGIYSTSDAAPVRSRALEGGVLPVPVATKYSDWKFVYTPSLPSSIPPSVKG